MSHVEYPEPAAAGAGRSSAATVAVECTYTAPDGAALRALRYHAPAARTALIYLHGIESHAGWFDTAARLFAGRGYDVHCLDRRGSGVNGAARGFVPGHTRSAGVLLDDVRAYLAPVRSQYAGVFLVGLSWGGKLALAYALGRPQDVDGLVLITPGLRARVDVSLRTKLRIVLASCFAPRTPIALPIEPEMFTRTPVHLAYIRDDPLRLHHVTARFLFESRRLDGFIARRIATNRLPIQLFLAGRDQIIDNAGVLRILRRGGQAELDVRTYDDQTHAIQLDAPQRLVGDLDAWLRRGVPAHA